MKVVLIVLDSVGIGELPDANLYGDSGSNTLKNISIEVGGLNLPNLEKLGLGKIEKLNGVSSEVTPLASYGKMAERSAGKDTTTGHWEIAGLYLAEPFATFPQGFPPEITEPFKKIAKSDFLGNYPFSGTEIIKKYGDEHVRTKKPIIYTSADSVFQIAAHEEVIPLERLYEICKETRKLLDKFRVGRVIARPFVGESGNYKRTSNRKDFSISPYEKTILDYLKEGGIEVIGIGKIADIFNYQGISSSYHTDNNEDGIEKTIKIMKQTEKGLIFTNLIDFDMLYGHRNDTLGYAKALEEFDKKIPLIIDSLKEDDLLIITADHGCDPTLKNSTDHTREYVPLIAYRKKEKKGTNLGIRSTFSDVAQTIAEFFNIKGLKNGKSFLSEV